MTRTDEQNQVPNVSPKGKALRFVEKLADAQDYWMSLTDAARVTRTSEAMARRWVSSGRLPVKQEPVGINQRTRLVRASDVARLRPIVDPTAAITDEIHKLDLLSIPRQHAQLMHEQRTLLDLVQRVQQTVTHLAEETHTGFEQEATRLQQQVQLWNQRLASHHQTIHSVLQSSQQQHDALTHQVDHQAQELQHHAEQLTTLATQHHQALERAQIVLTAQLEGLEQQVERLDQDYHAREEHLRHEYTVLFHQQEVQFRQALQGMEETLTHQDQERTRLHQHLTSLEQSYEALHHTISAQVEQRTQEIRAILEQQWRDGAEERAALTVRIEDLERQMEQVSSQIQGLHAEEQARTTTQEQQMHALAAQLQHEIDARQALLAHFDALKTAERIKEGDMVDGRIQERG